MLAVHNPSFDAPSSRLLGTPLGELKLRVQGGEHHGRILRISAAKCSIGSAPGCTLRLRGEGIEPLHCFILSGKNGTIIRRYSPRTYLNGGPFEDAALNPGDILRLGPVELAVVICPQSARRASPPKASATVEASFLEEAAKIEQRIAEEVSRVRIQEQVEQQRLASELGQMSEQLQIVREQLADALQLRDQATVDNQQAVEQLRGQYSEEMEQVLHQQQEERAQSRVREEQLQEKLRLAGGNAEELVSRLAEQEAASEELAKEHRQLVERLQEEIRAGQNLRQQEIEQLRGQYSEGMEQVLHQQQEERCQSQAREEQLLEELRLARKNVEELVSRLAEQEATSEELTKEHRQLVERLQDEVRAEQDLRQQERVELMATQQELQGSLAQISAEVDARRSELLELEHVIENATEQIRQLENQLNDARKMAEERATQHLMEQQQAQEEFTAVRGRLEASISRLTEQLQQREAELALSHRRGGECAETLTMALDDTRQELRELQVQRNQEEEHWTSYRSHVDQQLANLTTQLIERDHLLAQRDSELAEWKQRAAQLDTANLIVKHLEENLAAAAVDYQAEQENWLAEKEAFESQLRELQAVRIEGETCRNQLETQCSYLEAQRNELGTRLSALHVQHGELQSRFDILEPQLVTAQSECSALQSECRSLESQRSELEGQIARAQEAAQRREELERELASLQNSLDQVAAQEIAQQAAKEEAIRNYEEQVERWQSEAHKWQLQAEEVTGQLGPMQQRCAQLELENGKLQASTYAAGVAEEERQNLVVTRSQLEMQWKELAEGQARLQEEQAQLKQQLIDTAAREESLARYEAELRDRETTWEVARTEQTRILEERSQLIASQIAQFEAEQAGFARQQATIIQQMSTLEDRVQQLTTATESRSTNSPFVIPRLDDPALMGDLERAEQPYVRTKSIRSSEPFRLEDNQFSESTLAVTAAEVARPQATAESTGDETDLVSSGFVAADHWREGAAEKAKAPDREEQETVQEKSRYTITSLLDQAAEMIRQEELAGAAKQPDNKGFASDSQAPQQPNWKTSSSGKPEDDDSIEEYMNRLLSRVRGSDFPASATPASQNPQPKSGASYPAHVPAEISENPAEPKEYVPRVLTPEPPERLSLMRALANTAAKSAIQAHAKKAQKREIKQRSLIAILSLLGTTSLFVAGYFTGSMTALIGSLAFMVACCVMILRTLSTSLQQVRLPPPAENAGPSKAEKTPAQAEQN